MATEGRLITPRVQPTAHDRVGHLFDYLQFRLGSPLRPDNVIAAIGSMSAKHRREFVEGAIEATEFSERQAVTPFEFSVSEMYAGAARPCAAMSCRMRRLAELSYFAALYADRVVIPSPFIRALSALDGGVSPVTTKEQEVVAAVLFTMLLRPLLDAGIIEFAAEPSMQICWDCYAKLVGLSRSEFEKKLNLLADQVTKKYRDQVTYFAVKDGRDFDIQPRGPATLIDEHHYGTKTSGSARERLSALFVDGQSRFKLTKKQVDRLDIAGYYASPVIRDILAQNLCSVTMKTGYLTGRDVDLEVVDALSTPEIRDRNSLIRDGFSHAIPVLGSVPISQILKIRRTEWGAFDRYRNSLRLAYQEATGDAPKRAKTVFNDVVRPELAQMQATLEGARKTMAKGISVDATMATGFVSLGLFGGILPANLTAVVGAIGGYHFAKELATKIKDVVLEPSSLRDNKYYFLWKVGKLSSKRS
jgi:hypothetical protein